ncbi:MAG: hypothetical protein PHS07_00810 [Patescibacteria group bacterium]|nr:hypothetical protein [Patescibacteria group bacterium]
MSSDKPQLVHGYQVMGDEAGIKALEKFERSEAEVFFDYAREERYVKFEYDRMNFTLEKQGDVYQVTKRSSGWF